MSVEVSDFAEFHDELRSVAAELLAKDGAVGWQVLVDAGWTGLEIADEFGGAGATFTEVAVIAEELGRSAAASSHLGGVVLPAGALRAVVAGGRRDGLLSGVATGELRSAVVLDGFRLRDGLLAGRAEFVCDAEGADRLLIVADDCDTTAGPVLVDVPATGDTGPTVTPQPVLDETRRLAVVAADGVRVDDAAVLRFGGDPAAAVAGVRDRAAVAVACDSIGLAEAMLAATVSYAKVRHQFGRPIGSFQAVKHACADMLVQLSVSRRLVSAAVRAVAQNSPDAQVATAMAKSHAGTAAVGIVGKAMQLHGGIGYTWESGVHVYLKRATLNRALFGSPAAHRQRLAHRYR
ncbi:acyl-CoA dehydrogenase family protein [Mycolicibacterium palauense]|uniref:acyl-CoA dehydrogenase family protein n=1 Tax=Mycolicibacterium palauense TaxID=2034511 RepID=UPI000BFEC1BD|nr:acyl-CoA dehydrogenase family protein [Mycolicibacterium palauense]